MNFWRKIGTLALLLTVFVAVTGCDVTKIKDLTVTSVGVKYIVPTSSRSMDAVLLLGLDNPSISFTVQDVSGVVKHYDRELAHFTAGELPVQARSAQVYELPCTAVLSDKVSLLDQAVHGGDDGRCETTGQPERREGNCPDFQRVGPVAVQSVER